MEGVLLPLQRLGWIAWLGQRLLLFIVGVILISSLLHIQDGVQPPSGPSVVPRFSIVQWSKAEAAYLGQLLRGDPGVLKRLGPPGYRDDQPLSAVMRSQVPRSVAVVVLGLALSMLLGGLAGFLTSRFGARWLRSLALTGTLVILSAPDVLLVFFLRKLMIWGEEIHKIQGLLLSPNSVDVTLVHMVAPALALGCLPVALIARAATVAFDEVFDQLYIRTARAKGLSQWRVVVGHAARNAWIRIAESGPSIVGMLVTGLVVVELLLYYPGVGRTLGLILERGGQSAASSSIAVTLLSLALIIEGSFSLSRLLLDPRLRSQEAHSAVVFREWQAEILARLLAFRKAVQARAELLYFGFVTRGIWLMRPSRLVRELLLNWPLLVGTIGVGALLFLGFFGDKVADLRTVNTTAKYIVSGGQVFYPPFRPGLPGYPLGSDMEGRDVLARALVGARYTIFLTMAITPIRFLLALPWGLRAAYRGRMPAWWSKVLSLTLAGLPVMLIPAAIIPLRYLGAVSTPVYFALITLILAVVGVPRLAETVRLQADSVLNLPFLEGARAVGADDRRIVGNHVLPHLIPQLWVSAATDMAWTLLLMAQMGVFGIYLGGGERIGGRTLPRIPDWSSMLSKPYDLIYHAPWALLVPAVAFFAAVLAFNLFAEGLRRRQQAVLTNSPLPEIEVTPQGQVRIPARHWRSLGREWAVVAAIVAVITPATGAVLAAREKASAALAAQAGGMAQTRKEMQIALDTIYGMGSKADAEVAAAKLPALIVSYLVEARAARLWSSDIQEATRGHTNLFDLPGGVRVLSIALPQDRVGPGKGYLFIQDTAQTGRVQVVDRPIKPAYGTVTAQKVLVLAGTVPGPDNWVISIWSMDGLQWAPAPDVASALFNKIPAGYGAKLETGARSHEVSLTLGPLNSARVGAIGGDVEVCRSSDGPCVTIPYKDGSY